MVLKSARCTVDILTLPEWWGFFVDLNVSIPSDRHLTVVYENKKRDSANTTESLSIVVVPEVGIEPTWSCPRGILSPVRLPISPLRQ